LDAEVGAGGMPSSHTPSLLRDEATMDETTRSEKSSPESETSDGAVATGVPPSLLTNTSVARKL
jgi:hypothetical protein